MKTVNIHKAKTHLSRLVEEAAEGRPFDLLLWAAGEPEKLSARARGLIEDEANTLWFSAASLWEIAIKRALRRSDFRADPALLRAGLLDNGYAELPATGDHVIFVASLPSIHRDPFDRLLVAQASVEGLLLLTRGAALADYPDPIRPV